jgi:hypothetical protein
MGAQPRQARKMDTLRPQMPAGGARAYQSYRADLVPSRSQESFQVAFVAARAEQIVNDNPRPPPPDGVSRPCRARQA